MARIRVVSLVRLLAAGVFVVVTLALLVHLARDRRTPEVVSAAETHGAREAAAVDAPPLEHRERASAEPEETDLPGVLRIDADVVEREAIDWRFVAGVARRADTGLPTAVALSGRRADGGTTWTRTSNNLVGFSGKVAADAEKLVVTPHSTDLQVVEVSLPRGEDWSALDVELPLARGVLRARVVDERGDGVAGVVVAVGNGRRTTDTHGTVFFRPLRDDTYSVWLMDVAFSAHGSTSRRTVEMKGGVPTEPVMFIVPRGATLRGTVVADGAGTPVEGVDVVLTRPNARTSHRAARSDGKGFFTFEGLVPGAYRIAATSSDGVHGRLVVDIPPLRQDEVRSIELAVSIGAGTVAGRVLDESGAPVPFASIEALRSGEAGNERLTARSDSRGRFRLEALPAGTWSIGPAPSYCVTHNWIEGPGTVVTVRAGADAELDVRLRSGSFLEGRVVSASDRRDLRVRLHLDAERVLERPLGAGGRFAIGGVTPGTYLVEAYDPAEESGLSLASRMVYVAAGENASVEFDVP